MTEPLRHPYTIIFLSYDHLSIRQVIVIPILQIKKLRATEIKEFKITSLHVSSKA